MISESRRTGPVEARGDGEFVFPTHLVVVGPFRSGTYTGIAAITVEDDLIARYDLTQLTLSEASGETAGDLVAAEDARIDITYTSDGTTYVGDRMIIEGTASITLTNDTDAPATWSVWGYETGSEALAEELAFLDEGKKAVPINPLPVAGYYEIDYEWPADVGEPGSQIWTVELLPGTWIFDVGPESFRTTGLWRAAVIEVVSG